MTNTIANLPERSLTFIQRLPLARDRRWLAYGMAIALSVLGLAVRWMIDPALPAGFPYLTFFPAVILTAFFYGIGPGVVAAVICGLFSWYFFIAPANSLLLDYRASIALGFYVFIVTVDMALVHWMQRANARLAEERARSLDLARTREVLFAELQHRVGNNLQMISSILSLQERGVADDAARRALKDAARRLGMVGRMQRTLYSADGAQLSLATYLDQVARDTIDASGRGDIAYSFDSAITASLEPSAAIPAALIMAEAVSNSIEHGYATQGGPIRVTLAESADGDARAYVIGIEDEGAGLPAGFDAQTSDSLGLRLASVLAQSIDGRFELANRADERADGRGAVARLTIAQQ